MDRVLSLIAREFKGEKITWALGGSLMLREYGLINRGNDIDILIFKDHIDEGITILNRIKDMKLINTIIDKEQGYLYQYDLNGIGLDIISDFKLKHEDGIYDYIFDQKSIASYSKVLGEDIPLGYLIDWYIIYSLLPGKDRRANTIKKELSIKGIENQEIFNRILRSNIPSKLKEDIIKL